MLKSGWEVFMWKSLLLAAAIAAAAVTGANAAGLFIEAQRAPLESLWR